VETNAVDVQWARIYTNAEVEEEGEEEGYYIETERGKHS
jgi:hypothetical protein